MATTCPMIILAVNDFDSARAASPLLVVPSIASVFFPYCGLVGCLLTLGAFIGLLLYLSVGPAGIWLLRLPAFYEERLNWGV